MLRIACHNGKLAFTLQEEVYVKRWSATYDGAKGFEALEHFLVDLKKWFRR